MLGAGIRFVNLPQDFRPSKFTVNGNEASFEGKQKAPTYVLFNNAHDELWGSKYTDQEKRINTWAADDTPQSPFKIDTKEYKISIEIATPNDLKAEDFNINNLDIFAITAPANVKGARTEVHIAGFSPTELGNMQYFRSGNDDSSMANNKYYLSKGNLAWAVVIPAEFA